MLQSYFHLLASFLAVPAQATPADISKLDADGKRCYQKIVDVIKFSEQKDFLPPPAPIQNRNTYGIIFHQTLPWSPVLEKLKSISLEPVTSISAGIKKAFVEDLIKKIDAIDELHKKILKIKLELKELPPLSPQCEEKKQEILVLKDKLEYLLEEFEEKINLGLITNGGVNKHLQHSPDLLTLMHHLKKHWPKFTLFSNKNDVSMFKDSLCVEIIKMDSKCKHLSTAKKITQLKEELNKPTPIAVFCVQGVMQSNTCVYSQIDSCYAPDNIHTSLPPLKGQRSCYRVIPEGEISFDDYFEGEDEDNTGNDIQRIVNLSLQQLNYN